MGSRYYHGKGQFCGGNGCPLWSIWTFCRELCRNGLTGRFAVWVVDSGEPKKPKFYCIHQVVSLCPHWRAYWHHLANTIEPSVCDDDVVFCQITLTTCYCFFIIRPRSIIVAVDLIRRSNNCHHYSRDFGHASYAYTKHCTRFHRLLKFLSRKSVSSSTNLVSLCRSIPQYSTQNDNFADLIRKFPVTADNTHRVIGPSHPNWCVWQRV